MSAQLLIRVRLIASAAAVLVLAGCASTTVDSNLSSTQALAKERLGADVRWLTSEAARKDAQAEVDRLLQQPLSSDDAVRIALAHSPALQAVLFNGAAASASAAQAARMPNPVFTFERLVRNEGGERDLDIGRMLSIPVLDLLLLPARLRLADFQQQQVRLKLGGDVVQAALDARQAWVRAVAAGQSLRYFEQVKAAADASAELARRMQGVGNFSKLQRAREQAFSADAVAQLARARQTATSAREALVRAIGLNDAQALSLKLPERLPDLPATARDEQTVVQAAIDQRLDVRMARAELEFAARNQGLTRVTSLVNGFHVAGVRNSETGRAPQKGYELELPLPLFDFGDASRSRSQAIYMAALNRAAQLGVDAASQVRETYGAYRTAYDVARHYRDEIVPLRKTIADENLLRYNGMLIGVFELLADAREQIGSVVQAIEAQRDFWLVDAALQGALIGKPRAGVAMEARASGGGSEGGH
jgi:outer membrane protein TolC